MNEEFLHRNLMGQFTKIGGVKILFNSLTIIVH